MTKNVEMTNDERRMTKETRMTNDELVGPMMFQVSASTSGSPSGFVIRHSFGLRHSSFDILSGFVIRHSSLQLEPIDDLMLPQEGGWYSKHTVDSIRSKKPVVRPLRADANLDAPAAPRAMSHVMCSLPIDVNPCVYGTTGEVNPQKSRL